MKRILLGFTLVLLTAVRAWAACPTTTDTLKNAGGTTNTFCIGGTASTAEIFQHQILDSASAYAFPAVGALSDALANPTEWTIGSNLLGWDATNTVWRRLQVDAATGTLKIDGSAVTQPVSGTVTANAGTNLNTSALALSANQTNATQKTQIVDGSGNVIASTSNNLDVQCANCSGSGVSTADEATMTPGTSLFAGSGGFFQTTPTSNPLTTGKQGMFQVTAQRSLFTNLRDSSGNEEGLAAQPLQVDSPERAAVGGGTAPTNALVAGGVFNSSPLSLTTGQAAALQLDSTGVLKIDCFVNCGVAQGSTTSGQNGTLIMGAASTAAPATTATDSWPLSMDPTGNLRVSDAGGCAGATLANTKFKAITLASTTEAILVAASGSTQIYVCSVDFSSAQAAGSTVQFQFGTTTSTNCDTSTVNATGAYPLAQYGGLAKGTGKSPIWIGAASSALCIVASTSGAVAGSITYAQY